MKNCTPLWREAHFQVKMLKTPHVRTTLEVEKMKECTPLRREAHLEVKRVKTWGSQTTFGSWAVEKCTALWREAHFEVKMRKTPQCRSPFGSWDVQKVHAGVDFEVEMYKAHYSRTTFWGEDVLSCGRRKGFGTWPKVSKTWGFCSSFKKVDWQAWDIWRGSKMHFAWQAQYQRHMSQAYQEVRALISWEGCISEHQIFRFAKMILRDRCSTSYDLASLFVASAVLHSDGMEKLKDAMVRDRQLWNTRKSEASSWWARYNTKKIHCHYEKLAATDWARSKYFFFIFLSFWSSFYLSFFFIYLFIHFFLSFYFSFFYHFIFHLFYHFFIILFFIFYHFFIIFYHFFFQWCKKNLKNGKLQFSSSFFHFFIFLSFFLSFLLPVVELMKNDETWWNMIKIWKKHEKTMKKWKTNEKHSGKIAFFYFSENFWSTGSKNDETW